jgi:hypothetical protein
MIAQELEVILPKAKLLATLPRSRSFDFFTLSS